LPGGIPGILDDEGEKRRKGEGGRVRRGEEKIVSLVINS
jgi:hypothetical protein